MPASIHFLNRKYKEFFLDNSEMVTDNLHFLYEYLLEHQCTFRGEPMPTLLKPNFVSPKQSAILINSVERMSGALTRFIGLYMHDDRIQKIMGFSERENELFRIDPGYSNPLAISRLDAFLNDYSIKFLEFNCDSPAGIAYADVMEDGFREIFKIYPFLENFSIQYARRQELLLSSLLECYDEFRVSHRHMPEKPVIAIVDWADVSTYSEFELHQKHFTEHGVECIIATPQEFSISNGKAFARGQEVHLLYRRVITRELVKQWDEVGSFIESIKDGLVCCCNSFRSYIVGNKKVLSVISDQRFNSIFSSQEKQLIKQTIPWTRVLDDTRVTYHGKEVGLKSFVPDHKDKLVLKPSNSYGGKDVHIGIETPQSEWEKIILRHLEDETWVVQDYVDIPIDEFPELSESLQFKPKYVNINPFALNGKYSGTITRVSDSKVINVSAGGGLVPTLAARCLVMESD